MLSPLFDPNAPWRSEPASESQMRRLADEGVAIRPGMTKGEASDLISSKLPPGEEDEEILRFFRVSLGQNGSQFDARTALSKLFADPANVDRWNNRPATKDQRDLIKSIEGSVPANLTHDAALKRIAEYDNDDALSAKADAARDAQNAIEDRKISIRDYQENLNGPDSLYGVKRVRLALVTQAISEWEAEAGKALEQLEDDEHFFDRLAERIRIIDPSKATKEAQRSPESFRPWIPIAQRPQERKTSKSAGIVGWLVIAAFVYWAWKQ